MIVGFDASRAFVAEATGTENYSLSLLKALAKIDRKNRYRVYVRLSGRNKNSILKTRGPDNLIARLPPNFEIVKVGPSRLWTQIGLALETWKNPVDILFVPAHTLPILRRRLSIVNCLSEILPRRLSIGDKRLTKYVVTIHDLGVEYLPNYHKFPQRYYLDLASKYAAHTADALIAVSESTRRDLVTRYKVNGKKIFIVPEGVDTSFFKAASKKEIQNVKIKYQIEGNYILFVGTVQPRKNLETLIKAFARMIAGPAGRFPRPTSSLLSNLDTKLKSSSDAAGARRGSPTPVTRHSQLSTLDSQLVIAGKLGWDYQKILDLPKKLAVESRVKFLGYVNRQDLPSLYTGSTVFALPSLFEGFGLPILEALACGCPVAVSDIAAHREIYSKVTANRPSALRLRLEEFQLAGNSLKPETRNLKPETIGKAMILVKSNDLSKWTGVLYQYISLYNNRLSFISKKRNLRHVRQTIASTYSWEETAKQTLRVFQEVMR